MSEIIEALTARAMAAEKSALEYREIGGRNAEEKAEQLLAEFRLLRDAALRIKALEAIATPDMPGPVPNDRRGAYIRGLRDATRIFTNEVAAVIRAVETSPPEPLND